jgi:hypothetical protein
VTPVRHATVIHGWSVSDHGTATTGTLVEPLEALGYTVVAPSYGRVLTKAATREESRAFAKDLVIDIPSGALVIAHSNGCNVAREVSSYMPPRSVTMVWLHPALDPWRRPGVGVDRLLVVSSPNDWAVWAAQFVPWSLWGQMGRVGFQQDAVRYPGGESRVTNYVWDGGHSDFALEPSRWAALCDSFHRGA